jgi:hypothetical protein
MGGLCTPMPTQRDSEGKLTARDPWSMDKKMIGDEMGSMR